MVATFVSMTLVWGTLGGIGGHFGGGNGWILPPGPGYGWGFPNGNPDGYGYRDDGVYLPLWSDRTSEYYFPRYFMVPPDTLFFPTYYNAYLSRGQRYIPYAGLAAQRKPAPASCQGTGGCFTMTSPRVAAPDLLCPGARILISSKDG